MKKPMKLILAPPGAGKTRALVEQINDLLDSGVSPYRILATTFSREGARELSDRLGGDVTVRTVHSLAWWVVRIAHRARDERLPQILPPEDALLLIERAMKRVEVKFFEPAQVQTEMAAVREQGCSLDALHPSVQKVIRAYHQLLEEEHKIDFTGVLAAARKELEDPELKDFLSGLHIFIDEGQDISALTEWPVLEGFRHVSEQFVLMASPSQQIYGFKGADWTRLSAQFPEDTETSYLEHNYRSTPEIIEASRRLAGPDARHMRPVRPSLRQPVTLALCLDQGLEVEFIGRAVQHWQASGVALPEIAILARAHALHYPIQDLLRACNLPYRVVGDRPDFYTRPEIQAALSYLDLALDPTNPHALESILNYPPAGIGVRLRRRLRGDRILAWKHLEDAMEDPASFPPQLVQRAREMLVFQAQSALIVQANETVANILERLLSLAGIPAYLEGEGDYQGMRALRDLVTSAVEYETLEKFRGHLADEINRPRPTEGIQLATLHAAKGREWQAVLLPNFQDGVIPLRKMDSGEEQNLAFVGLTRARDHMAITLSRQGLPSPFLNEMPAERVQWP